MQYSPFLLTQRPWRVYAAAFFSVCILAGVMSYAIVCYRIEHTLIMQSDRLERLFAQHVKRIEDYMSAIGGKVLQKSDLSTETIANSLRNFDTDYHDLNDGHPLHMAELTWVVPETGDRIGQHGVIRGDRLDEALLERVYLDERYQLTVSALYPDEHHCRTEKCAIRTLLISKGYHVRDHPVGSLHAVLDVESLLRRFVQYHADAFPFMLMQKSVLYKQLGEQLRTEEKMLPRAFSLPIFSSISYYKVMDASPDAGAYAYPYIPPYAIVLTGHHPSWALMQRYGLLWLFAGIFLFTAVLSLLSVAYSRRNFQSTTMEMVSALRERQDHIWELERKVSEWEKLAHAREELYKTVAQADKARMDLTTKYLTDMTTAFGTIATTIATTIVMEGRGYAEWSIERPSVNLLKQLETIVGGFVVMPIRPSDSSTHVEAVCDTVVKLFSEEALQKNIKITLRHLDPNLRIFIESLSLQRILVSAMQWAMMGVADDGFLHLQTQLDYYNKRECMRLTITSSGYYVDGNVMVLLIAREKRDRGSDFAVVPNFSALGVSLAYIGGKIEQCESEGGSIFTLWVPIEPMTPEVGDVEEAPWHDRSGAFTLRTKSTTKKEKKDASSKKHVGPLYI